MSESNNNNNEMVNGNHDEAEDKQQVNASEILINEVDVGATAAALAAEVKKAETTEIAVAAAPPPPATGAAKSKCEFDVFISYNWDHKIQVRKLYEELTKKYGLKCWMDEVELKASGLMDELAKGIQNSRVICCCITKAYCKSDNCISEINYAKGISKPMVVLMFERLNIQALGGVGFIIGKLIRVNAYKFEAEGLFLEPSGELFKQVLKALRDKLDEEDATPGAPGGAEEKEEYVRALTGHNSAVLCLQELTNNRVASASSDHSIIIWNMTECTSLKKLEKHTDVVTCMKVLPEAKLASGSMDSTIIIWNLISYEIIRILKGHAEGVTCLKLLPDQTELVSGANDFTLRIWNLKKYECTKEIRGHVKFYKKFFMSIQKGTKNVVKKKILNVQEPSYNSSSDRGGGAAAASATAASNQDDSKTGGANDANVIEINGNKEKGQENDQPNEKQNIVSMLRIKIDENKEAEDKKAAKEEVKEEKPEAAEELPEYNEDEEDIAEDDGYSKTDSKSVNRVDGHTKSVYCLKNIRSKDGTKESRTRFASGSGDKQIKVWDINSNYDLVATFKGHLGQIICMKNLPKMRLASGSVDKTIRIWDMEKLTQLKVLTGHTADIQCMQTIDSGKRLVTGSCDTTIRVWNLGGKFDCVKTIKEHTKYVNILKKIKNDRLLSSANDNSIKVWDVRNKVECIQTFKEHQKWVSHILLLENGKVCSCSWDGSIKVWKPQVNP